MKRTLLLLLTILLVGIVFLFIHIHPTIAISRSGCFDIPASPDYLSTANPHDAIAAINNARQVEHVPPLRLPVNFYQLDPQQQQFLLVNDERMDRGLHPLLLDANLSQLALGYSKQLRDLHFFAHTSPISGTFSDRINENPALTNHYSIAAENLAGNPVPGIGPIYEYMYDDVSENCGHRHNILTPELTHVGINWVSGGAYGSMSAQEFIGSAPWSPYPGAPPDTLTPRISISTSPVAGARYFQCLAIASENGADLRITWFLDRIGSPLATGLSWQVDMRHLTPGKHTLYAFAVNGEQNYSKATYTFTV